MQTDKPKFILYTVPHTGTFFTFRFLNKIGYERGRPAPGEYKDYYHVHPLPPNPERPWLDTVLDHRLVVTARNPARTFLSHLVRAGKKAEPEKVVTKLKGFYDRFFDNLDKNPNYVILTLDCEEHLREKTLMGVAEYLGTDLHEYGESLKKYAKDWMPFHYYRKESQGISRNPLIAEYDENPSMMERFDLTELHEAFQWYQRVRVKE